MRRFDWKFEAKKVATQCGVAYGFVVAIYGVVAGIYLAYKQFKENRRKEVKRVFMDDIEDKLKEDVKREVKEELKED